MRVKCNDTSMPEHSINEAFLYLVFVMTPDFSKFRVKRDWSHGLRCLKEVPPECRVEKGRDPWVPEKSGLTCRMEAWGGGGAKNRSGRKTLLPAGGHGADSFWLML